MSVEQASRICIVSFPLGQLLSSHSDHYRIVVGTDAGQLVPGTYNYWARDSGNRVTEQECKLAVNVGENNESITQLIYGQPFEFTFYTYHGAVMLSDMDFGPWDSSCDGILYRIGD